ncbi:MAG TPA: ABC transporter permease [Thermoanaerobaculia bacterium]
MPVSADIRTALRSLRKSPAFALFATLALAAGIGLTLYMFGAINAFVIRPLPFKDADRLLHVELADPTLDQSGLAVPYPDYLVWQRELTSVSDFAAYWEGTLNLADTGDPERLEGAFVTGNLFAVLGVRAEIGRVLGADDSRPGAPAAVVLSRRVWERRYGSDASIIGRATRVNGRPATIVGVMAEGFRFPTRTEAWATIPESAATARRDDLSYVEVIGHAAPGHASGSVAAEIESSLARMLADDSSRQAGLRPVVKPFVEEYVGPNTRKQLAVMFVAVVFVLLIACANVANLLYARGVGRKRDLAVRAALGASRRRLIAFGLTEALVVSLLASGIGLVLAQRAGNWTMESLRGNEDMDIPSWVHFETDATSVAFTVGVAIAAALAAGLAPAMAGSRPDVQQELRGAGRGGPVRSRRVLRVLVVGQIALCCGLVTSAGLAARSIAKLYRVELGVDGERILGARIAMFEERFPDTASLLAFYQRAEARLRELPGVVESTVTSSLPGTFVGGGRIEVEGLDLGELRLAADIVRASPSYFETLGVALAAGRGFAAADDADSERVAIVNRTFVERYFEGSDPLGRRLRAVGQGEPGPWLRVVGVAPDVLQDEIDDPLSPTYYVPLAQDPPRFAFLAVRASGSAATLKEPLRKAVAELDPDQPVYFLRTLDEWVAIIRWSNRFLAGMFATFALAGLALAALGVYGMAAYAVAQRTAEIGLRRALGAHDRAVISLVAKRSAQDLAWGLALGSLLAVALARPLAGMFYGVEAFDPPAFGAVPLVLFVAVAIATAVPARRALRVEPASALREE